MNFKVATAAGSERSWACASLQMFYTSAYKPDQQVDNLIDLAKQIDFRKAHLRSRYLEFIERAGLNLMMSFDDRCLQANGLTDLNCLKRNLDKSIEKLKTDPLWVYYECKIIIPKSKPSYSDLADQVEELQDRIEQLESE